MTWIIAALAIGGTLLNIYKSKWCFAIWVCTNGYWAVYDFSIGSTAQAAQFLIYFCLAVWGLWKWAK